MPGEGTGAVPRTPFGPRPGGGPPAGAGGPPPAPRRGRARAGAARRGGRPAVWALSARARRAGVSFERASRPERGGGQGGGAPAEARVPGLTTRESVHRLQVPGHLPRMLVPGGAVRIRLFRAPAREASTPA